MKISSSTALFAAIIVAQLFAVAIIFQTILGISDSGAMRKREDADSNTQTTDPKLLELKPEYDRLVIFLVDALRDDMVSSRPEMRFVRQLLHRNLLKGYTARAHSPTVTMPRIKAIVSGGVPQFLDLVTNLISSEQDAERDTLISRLRSAGKSLVLFGDDTWLKLFPGVFLSRSDGTTSSFFTPDFVEVDTNVTRHIGEDFDPKSVHPASRDWDVAILHYLGLDHIGHQLGPDSERMSQKLKEMDHAFEQVYRNIAEQDHNRNIKTLVVLLSDHGMNNAGNHGGNSRQEVSAVALFAPSISDNDLAKESEHEILLHTIPLEDAFQVDLAPSLGLAMGVGIPSKSVGCVLRGAFKTNATFSRAADVNVRHHLMQKRCSTDEKYEKISCEGIQAELLAKLSRDHVVTSSETMLKQTICLVILILAFLFQLYLLPENELNGLGGGSSLTALAGTVVIHLLSAASSSAIENEHATVFYLLTTVLLFMLTNKTSTNHRAVFALLTLGRIMHSRLEVINFSRLAGLGDPVFLNQGTSVLPPYFGFGADPISPAISLAVIHGITLQLGRYGNNGNLPLLLPPIVATWVSKYILPYHTSAAQFAMYGFVGAFLLSYRMSRLEFVRDADHGLFAASCGFASMIHRDANLPVLAVGVTMLFILRTRVQTNKGLRLTLTMLTGWALFFALGNSHSVSTIDIAAGYVGSTQYQLWRVAIITTLAVYTGPLLACFSLVRTGEVDGTASARIFWLIQSARLTFVSYILILMQGHLFVWSVFAPRFAYELMWTCCLLFFLGCSERIFIV